MTSRAPAVSVPTAGVYAVDAAKSTITFTTRHMFGLGKVAGTFAFRSADLIVADPLSESSARAEIDAASFSTGFGQRDKKVRSKAFLNVASFPVITFNLQHVRSDADTWVLVGVLTAHGVSAPIGLRLNSSEVIQGALTLNASGSVDRYAHGIRAAKGMAARHLHVEISVAATRVS